MTENAKTNPGGRPALPDKERMVVVSMRLTPAMRDQFRLLGGAEWLRPIIRKATSPKKAKKPK